MAMQSQRDAQRARERPYDPVAARRWRATHRLTRYGLTPETFDRLLASQDNACAMCYAPFAEGQKVHIDHDHNLGCHPDEKSACDKCRRGLLCLRCNTGLGFIEKRLTVAQAYLARYGA
jgi:hypothetical protein